MRRRAFLGALLTMAGSLVAEQVQAQCAAGRRLVHFGGHDRGSYARCNYWTPRAYPVVACCRGVTIFEEPPGAVYPICLKKFHNPDFVGYHGAYSGYDRAPQVQVVDPAEPSSPSPQ